MRVVISRIDARDRVLAYFKHSPGMTAEDAIDVLELHPDSVAMAIEGLRCAKKIERIGSNRPARFALAGTSFAGQPHDRERPIVYKTALAVRPFRVSFQPCDLSVLIKPTGVQIKQAGRIWHFAVAGPRLGYSAYIERMKGRRRVGRPRVAF